MANLFEVKIIRSEEFVKIDQLITPGRRGFRKAVQETTQAVAKQAEKLMKLVIANNALDERVANKPATFSILRARSLLKTNRYRGAFPSSPLSRNHELYHAIRTVDLRNGDYFVGITSGARMKFSFDRRTTGRSPTLAQVAAINERGAKIKVGQKMRGFFFAMASAARKKGIDFPVPPIGAEIIIPKRSFRKPVAEAFKVSGFGEGHRFEMEAERAFLRGLMTVPYLRRFMKVRAA